MISENEAVTQAILGTPSDSRHTERVVPGWLLDVACVLALTLAAVVFFRDVLFGQGVVFTWDFIEFMYPAQRFVSNAIHAGELPLWNPTVLGGYPVIADPQAAVLYPPYLLYHLLPGQPPLTMRAFEWIEVLHIAVAGMGAYGLARVMGVGRLGGLLAGLAFMLGGFFPVHVQHTAWIVSTAWLPVVLMFTVLTLDRRRLAYVVGLAAALALSLLGGYTQQALLAGYTALALTGWWLWRAYRDGRLAGAWRAVMLVVVGLALGGLLTMAQTLPTLDTVRETVRSDTNRDWGQYGAISRAAVVSLILPSAFGSAGGQPYVGGEVTHSQKYMGLAVLILAAVAFVTRLGNPYATFWRGLTVVTALGSFGPNLYIYRLILLLPLMNLFRRPSTLYPIALLGAVMLAAMLVDRLLARDGGRRSVAAWLAAGLGVALALAYAVGAASSTFWPRVLRRLPAPWELRFILAPEYAPTLQAASLAMLPYAVALTLLLLAVVVARRGRGWLAVGLVLLTFLDLRAFNADQIFNTGQADPTALYQMPFLATMGAGLGRGRVEMPDIAGGVNTSSVVGVESLSGYNPLLLQRLLDYVAVIPSVNSRLFDALNVRYLIVDDAFLAPQARPVTFADVVTGWSTGTLYIPPQLLDSTQWTRVNTAPDKRFHLWENRRALPRVWGVEGYRVLAERAARLAALRAPDFEPTREALLETEPGGALTGRLIEPVAVESYRNNGFQVRAEVAGGDALMVISVPYHPGWRASLDGQPTAVYPADHLFMAVRVPQGVHTVRLDFAPTAWTIGRWLTVLAVALCAALLAWEGWRGWRRDVGGDDA